MKYTLKEFYQQMNNAFGRPDGWSHFSYFGNYAGLNSVQCEITRAILRH